MLTKDLLRVSRAGGGYHPQFAEREYRPLAARVIGTVQGHVGEPRSALDSALEELERDAEDYKLVRGLGALLERDCTFETEAPIEPTRARRAAFEAAEAIGVVTEDERAMALIRAGEGFGLPADDVETALYADLDERQILTSVESRWDPENLVAQYNLSLAQTALFDATEVSVRSSDPKALITAVKRLRLMYEIRKTDEGREVVVTGPTSLFRATRRYGTRFARLLRTLAGASEWHLEATIDDRGTERKLALSDADPISIPDADPVAEVSFDSDVEADFAGRFTTLPLEWSLVREPEPLATGTRVMIPDFAFDYDHDDFRVYFEIMGFWTPEYVEKKLTQLEGIDDVEMVVAVDDSLGVGEAIGDLDHRSIPYSNRVRMKDVAEVLREYENELIEASAAEIPDELVPSDDVVSLSDLAAHHGVSEEALESITFPEHDLVGRTLVRPRVLDSLGERIGPGMTLAETEAVFDDVGVSDSSAVLAKLGYRVEWDGLSGGTIAEREDSR